jgi:GDPmannose 4,6-dehydratase
MSKKIALITGITGQCGRFLTELLLDKDYEVFGLVRRTSNVSTNRIAHLLDKITLVGGDLTDEASLIHALEVSRPDEVYNLAAQSLVPVSWDQPILTAEVTGVGVAKLLSAIRTICPKAKFLQMSSSEMFGLVREIPQTELTPLYPRSPYAVAKCFGHWATINHRESYGMFAATSICFNFESPHRGLEFVTKKITDGVAKIVRGETKELRLGNIEAKRDWSFAGDVVRAMHMIMQHDEPDDFVVSTGETHSVKEFLEIAFRYFNLNWQDYVVIDQSLIRPAEVPLLLGDSNKIKTKLGWTPKVKFHDLVNMMIEHELSKVKI